MNQLFKIAITSLVLLISLNGIAQESKSNTLKFAKDTISPKATLDDVSWIQGHWKGEAFGGITEEIWSPPLGDSMMFQFKLVVENKVVFYEFGGIREEKGTLRLQFKHFHGDFKGWEEKDEIQDYKLVKIEGNRVYFEDFTFEKISGSEINLYVVIGNKDGTSQEMKFNYKK